MHWPLRLAQRLTGFKIAGQWDKKRRERSLEWVKQFTKRGAKSKGSAQSFNQADILTKTD